jgi:isoleucyl-tRNA synthetase
MSGSPHKERPYPPVDREPDYPRLEEQVLERWAKERTFQSSVENRPGGHNEFVFYDGPPFANGLPHYGHLLTGFVKDAVPRYQTMRGRRVERRFGWDCHGLPAEMAAEKELSLAGRSAVEAYGIDRFNDYCRSLVQRTTDAWEGYVTRQGRWVDFANDYRTMDLSYMESVMWAFKQLFEKGLAYEGERVLPYCWECETPLANFETRQDDSYRPREDPAVTVAFSVDPDPNMPGPAGEALRVLVWTTTPWTLPSNLALAVGPDICYQVFLVDGEHVLVAEDRVAGFAELFGETEPLVTLRGADLVGRTYRPLFDFFAQHPGAFRVLAGEFVATDEGTGVVHLAPGFGEEDHDVCVAAGISVVCPVDDQGRFTREVPPYAGQQVFDANKAVIADLKTLGVLVRRESYVHSYPHCWRTDTPLIYKSMRSWFVRVTAIKDRMAALNQEIDWVPAHIRDGAFGKWLDGARDWSISRNRFWGSPIPVWESDDPQYPRIDVYGSLAELEADFGVRLTDLHRPSIDTLTRPNPDDPTGRSTMRRVSDVLDCWFDSGSMPFAQVHYPFEQAEWFDAHFPADFIVEYVGQTRGWFYTLHVLSTALFDRPPFRHCIAHGIVLGDDGRKMSKRLGNYPEPDEIFATLGADAMRWFLLSSAVLRGQDLVVEAKSIAEVVRQVLNPIWNAWYFLTLYAGIDQIRGQWRTDAPGLLDRYILAETALLVESVTTSMDAYDLFGACATITSFLDTLNNWYIRRSRDRFWRPVDAADAGDKRDAYDTLSTVLTTLCTVAAPLLPMLTENVYRGLTGEQSVHLADWPAADALPADPDLVSAMRLVREVCSAAHAVRKANGLRARLPLARLRVASLDADHLASYTALIADEVNVRDVVLTTDVREDAEQVLIAVPAALGPRIGGDTQKVLGAIKRGEWTRHHDGTVEAAGIRLEEGEYALVLRPRDPDASRSLPGALGVVSLDLTLTPELAAEGLARDIVRLVQESRKAADLHVADRIELTIAAAPDILAALDTHREHVAEQTQALSLETLPEGANPADRPLEEAFAGELPDDRVVHIWVRRAHRETGELS